MTPALSAALSAITAARLILRSRTPGTPAGDKDEEHEANTYGLPEGAPIRKAFKRFAKRQLRKTLSRLPEIGAPLPTHFPSVADWTNPMASAMTPLVGIYWDEAGSTTRARLGLDPDKWEVHDPHLHEMIERQAFRFCESTNQTTDKELGEALEDLRQEFIEGLVTEGETIPELTRRVQKVFGRLGTVRAEMIARTEAARAVHAASIVSAKESGVVSGKKWLLSADACERCHAAAAKFPGGVGLDLPFSDDGKGTDYSSCEAPPLHPNCRCSITFVLSDEYEKLLAEHGPPEPELFDYEGGSLGPEPKKRTRPKPKPKPLDWSKVTDPDLSEFKTRTRIIDSARERFVNDYSNDFGVRPDAVRAKVAEGLQNIFEHGEPYRRMDTDDLLSVLSDGRFKSQFEVGRSAGYYGPSTRAELEAGAFATPPKIKKSLRPIYGYLGSPDFGGAGSGPEAAATHWYGGAVVRFKKSISDRTTLTVGDSLNHRNDCQGSRPGNISLNCLPTGGNRHECVQTVGDLVHETGSAAKNLRKIQERFSYIELQWHGGVKADLIDEVGFAQEPDPDLKQALADRNIPWRIIP